jgi:zinc transport system substrate-binding protein
MLRHPTCRGPVVTGLILHEDGMPFPFRAVIGALLLAAVAVPARAEVPRVVVSIKPVHSLVAAVMAGVGEPALLVDGAQSPHTYSLRPSDARGLAEADVVFWIGPPLETFLERPLSTLAEAARVVALVGTPGLTLHGSGDRGHPDHGHPGDHDHPDPGHEDPGHEDPGHGGHAGMDAHVWLDVANARAMVGAIADALAATDPGNAAA